MQQSNFPEVVSGKRELVIELPDNASDRVVQELSNEVKRLSEVLILKLEEQSGELSDVKKSIEAKHISPADLDALTSLVGKKASKYIEKQKGFQLNIDALLSYDTNDLSAFQALVNDEVGKVKSRIWIELNKDCLHRKGNAPRNRILDKQVEQAFDFVRKWGGFSV